jgi:hypothetical protein
MIGMNCSKWGTPFAVLALQAGQAKTMTKNQVEALRVEGFW